METVEGSRLIARTTIKSEKCSDIQHLQPWNYCILSGHVADELLALDGCECKNGIISSRSDLRSRIEEADTRIIPHISNALENGC